MIIIGGKTSSNTRKLYEVAAKSCNNSYLIQTVKDLPVKVKEYKKVGIMAGASTPDYLVQDVVDFLK